MTQPGFFGPLLTGLRVDGGSSSSVASKSKEQEAQQELELKLAAARKQYSDLQAAIFEATQVHRRLCAPGLLRHGDFEIASEAFAARHLPGDFFSVEETGNKVVVALGDITGKGLAAGMWTTLLLGLVGLHRSTSAEPQVIASGVNRDLCRMALGTPLVSLFIASLDPVSGKLDYCSAGHPPALLLRKDGQLDSLSDGGPLLGVVPEFKFVCGTVELGAGDVLLTYSDGLLEAHDHADQEFGLERLEGHLRRAGRGSANEVLFSLLAAIQDFAGACLQADDMSVVVMRRAPRATE
jgi:sigma-B regulation protein RsbU (phosphoserine phosphatase)